VFICSIFITVLAFVPDGTWTTSSVDSDYYFKSFSGLDYDSANSYCSSQFSGALADVSGTSDYSTIGGLVNSGSAAFVGLEAAWLWGDGGVHDLNWNSATGLSPTSTRVCGAISNDGTLTMADCSVANNFICQVFYVQTPSPTTASPTNSPTSASPTYSPTGSPSSSPTQSPTSMPTAAETDFGSDPPAGKYCNQATGWTAWFHSDWGTAADTDTDSKFTASSCTLGYTPTDSGLQMALALNCGASFAPAGSTTLLASSKKLTQAAAGYLQFRFKLNVIGDSSYEHTLSASHYGQLIIQGDGSIKPQYYTPSGTWVTTSKLKTSIDVTQYHNYGIYYNTTAGSYTWFIDGVQVYTIGSGVASSTSFIYAAIVPRSSGTTWQTGLVTNQVNSTTAGTIKYIRYCDPVY
jgi:hypothetical protein